MLKEVMNTKDYALKQPLLSLNSELFHLGTGKGFIAKDWVVDKFDSMKATTKVFDDTKENHKEGNYHLVLKGTAHNDMTDRCLYLRRFCLKNDLATEPNKYQVFVDIAASFLSEHKFLPVEFPKKVMGIAKVHI